MKALIARVHYAKVLVDNHTVGAIDFGLLVYLGIGLDDNACMAQKMMQKIVHYRIFEDDAGKMSQSLLQQSTKNMLIVPQFTLMADTNKGRRPDFSNAMAPNKANALFLQALDFAKSMDVIVQSGQFGADMQVICQNDGPSNFILQV